MTPPLFDLTARRALLFAGAPLVALSLTVGACGAGPEPSSPPSPTAAMVEGTAATTTTNVEALPSTTIEATTTTVAVTTPSTTIPVATAEGAKSTGTATTGATPAAGGVRAPAAARSLPCAEWLPLAAAVGWHSKDLPWLAKTMRTESTCDPTQHNTRNRDDSYGLMQVNVKGPRLLADRQALCGFDDPALLLDPETNLRCALAIHARDGKGPW